MTSGATPSTWPPEWKKPPSRARYVSPRKPGACSRANAPAAPEAASKSEAKARWTCSTSSEPASPPFPLLLLLLLLILILILIRPRYLPFAFSHKSHLRLPAKSLRPHNLSRFLTAFCLYGTHGTKHR